MDAEKSAVYECGDGECLEGADACVVHFRRVLVQTCESVNLGSNETQIRLTFSFEREVFGQMSTLVVSAQQKQSRGIAQLEGVEVEQTLRHSSIA